MTMVGSVMAGAHLKLQVKCPRRPLLESNAGTTTHNHAGIYAQVSPWLVGSTQ